jgi:hypothetical protein
MPFSSDHSKKISTCLIPDVVNLGYQVREVSATFPHCKVTIFPSSYIQWTIKERKIKAAIPGRRSVKHSVNIC